MSSDLQTNIKLLINRSTNYRRFFHLAYTGRLPLYSLIRHEGFARLVLRNKTFLANIFGQLSDPEIHDPAAFGCEALPHPLSGQPDFTLLAGGGGSCMAEQRDFDASIDELYGELKSLLKDAYQLSPEQLLAQLTIDTQPEVVRLTLRYIWDAVCDSLLFQDKPATERDAYANFPDFARLLASNIEFFEPVLSSLPETSDDLEVRLEAGVYAFGKWRHCLGNKRVDHYRQELEATVSLLRDLFD
ncbi:hypothetical protein EPA01_005160 [Escherichia coli]|nr:hypothetical protein [Escherichia coli]